VLALTLLKTLESVFMSITKGLFGTHARKMDKDTDKKQNDHHNSNTGYVCYSETACGTNAFN
jgi:hypothetical protein